MPRYFAVAVCACAASLLLSLSVSAQMRGVAGGSMPMGGAGAPIQGMPGMSLPMGGAGPLGPITPGLAPVSRGSFTGFGFGFPGHGFNFPRNTFKHPFPLFPFGTGAFPGFWWGYPFVESEQPQVVFVPAPPEEPPPPPHIVEPKIINVPATTEPETPPKAKPTTVLVWRDGHQTQVRRYAIVGSTLFDYTEPRRTNRIALDELDLEATVAINQQHGVAFRIPATANEVAVNF